MPKLPTFRRIEDPPPMRFTERDRRILMAIHAFDGMMGDYQIQRLFFTGRRQMQIRMSRLYQHGYVDRPDRQARAKHPCMVYVLGKRGAEYLASLDGVPLDEFSYRGVPRKQVEHDLAINDFRLNVMEACDQTPSVLLEEWIHQGEFWAYPDTVEYIGQKNRKVSRKVRPDAFFSLFENTSNYRYRFLVEIDMATEDNPRFSRDKVMPGVAYIRSDVYEKRFGYKSGRWLVVTTGERRLKNMVRQTEQVAKKAAALFFFTTFDQVAPETVLTDPIWRQGGNERLRSLIKDS